MIYHVPRVYENMFLAHMKPLRLDWPFSHSRSLSLNCLGMLIMTKEIQYDTTSLRQVTKLPALIWKVIFQSLLAR